MINTNTILIKLSVYTYIDLRLHCNHVNAISKVLKLINLYNIWTHSRKY